MKFPILEQVQRIDFFTPLQRERYEKIVASTQDLLHDRGYEATTIREVSQAAQVGNGTIYRYFRSRDALIYVATAVWSIELGYQQRSKERGGLSLRERILASVGDGADAMLADANMVRAWVAVRQSTDPELVEIMSQSNEYRAVNAFSFPDPDDPLQRDLNVVMEAQTVHGLWKWARGIIDAETFRADLLRSVHLVFDAHGQE